MATLFQPTLPARGATLTFQVDWEAENNHFNPRSPHGERPITSRVPQRHYNISTHAPRTGSDRRKGEKSNVQGKFQPTLPARGATCAGGYGMRTQEISTHAPRTGSDTPEANSPIPSGRFQPTLPARGATYARRALKSRIKQFQPTLPARGATVVLALVGFSKEISTHAPRTGSDCGGRLASDPRDHISTHAPRTGSDHLHIEALRILQLFQPTLPARGATNTLLRSNVTFSTFQPTLPARGATRVGLPTCNVDKKISTHAPRTGSDV